MTKPKNPQASTVVDRSVANMLIRLFAVSYKLGVNDAFAASDEGLCRQHVEQTQQPGYFGRVGDDISHDALYWQIKLKEAVYRSGFYEPLCRYLRNMGRYGHNYLSVALPIAQEFYNRGLTDYCKAPGGCEIALFNDANKAWWTAKGPRNVKTEEYVEQVQLMTFQRQHIDEGGDPKKVLKSRHYELFRRCIGMALASRESYYG
ncbi:MAG: hypothetical protein NC209_03955 [Alistipes sp.]|nr:hypothetical protein [Lachnospiraceae bacterium]MCM1250285.1 hypothetical protein [Alistipes sp.]